MSSIRWLRIGAESVAIVASILLAFAIDAWWQRRGEVRLAETLISSLIVDFESSQLELQRALSEQVRNQRVSEELLASIRGAELGSQVTITMEQAIGSFMGPTYSPTTAAIDIALSTGQINLLEDQALRNKLAVWQQLLADNAEEELEIREIGRQDLLPHLSRQIRYGRFLNSDLISEWRADASGPTRFDEQVQFQVSAEFEGLLSNRVFLGNFVVQQLDELGTVQGDILEMLRVTSRD